MLTPLGFLHSMDRILNLDEFNDFSISSRRCSMKTTFSIKYRQTHQLFYTIIEQTSQRVFSPTRNRPVGREDHDYITRGVVPRKRGNVLPGYSCKQKHTDNHIKKEGK
jgi:hypothetical protein